MIDITDCKSLNDIAVKLFNKKNYTNREKVKKYLKENGIDWVEWLNKINTKPSIRCKCCGKIIESPYNGQKFCSRSCAATFNNIKRGNMPLETKKKISFTLASKSESFNESEYRKEIHNLKYDSVACLNCGKEIKRNFRSKKVYCSAKCQHEYQQKEYIIRWKKGEEDGLNGQYNLSHRIRKYLLEKHNYKCECCGWGERNIFTNSIPLEIHHKDGNYKNNKEENLQVLCPNCHSLTETFKSHNKNGRKKRNKYN